LFVHTNTIALALCIKLIRQKSTYIFSYNLWKFAGIGPDSKNATDYGENTEQEQKSVREALISAYEKNISTRLKAELCNLDPNNYYYTKDASESMNTFSLSLLLY